MRQTVKRWQDVMKIKSMIIDLKLDHSFVLELGKKAQLLDAEKFFIETRDIITDEHDNLLFWHFFHFFPKL